MINKLKISVKYAKYEIFLMKLMFSILLLNVFFNFPTYPTQALPHGIAQYIDLTFFNDPLYSVVLRFLFMATLILYVFGIYKILVLGYLLFYTVGLVTLYFSQGGIGHLWSSLSYVILAQFIVYMLEPVYRKYKDKDSIFDIDDVAIYFTQQIIASIYVVAGLAKLYMSKFIYGIIPVWVIRTKFMPVSVIKSHDIGYYNTGNSFFWDKGEWIANFLIQNPVLTQFIFACGLIIELLAFLLLINRACSIVVGLSLIGLHVGIMLLVNVYFWENIWVIAIYALHIPWLIMIVFNKVHLYLKSKEIVQVNLNKKCIVFYDGVCGLCNQFVQSVLNKDVNQVLKFAPIQGSTAEDKIGKPDGDPKAWSIIFYDDGKVYKKSQAVIEIYKKLGGLYSVLGVLSVFPLILRDTVYEFVARNRYKWFGQYDTCKLPTVQQKNQLMD